MSSTSNSNGPATPIRLSLLHTKQQAFGQERLKIEQFGCGNYTIELNSLFQTSSGLCSNDWDQVLMLA